MAPRFAGLYSLGVAARPARGRRIPYTASGCPRLAMCALDPGAPNRPGGGASRSGQQETIETPLGLIRVNRSGRGMDRFELEISRPDLGKYKLICADDPTAVLKKAQKKLDEWQRRSPSRRDSKKRAAAQQRSKEMEAVAARRTEEARRLLGTLHTLLDPANRIDGPLDWEVLKDHGEFPVPKPEVPLMPQAPAEPVLPPEPKRKRLSDQGRLSLLDRLSASRRRRQEEALEEEYHRVYWAWELRAKDIRKKHVRALAEHGQSVALVQKAHAETVAEWEEERRRFQEKQALEDKVVDAQRAEYAKGAPAAIAAYSEAVLRKSKYPDFFPCAVHAKYIPDERLLAVDYGLPEADTLPTLTGVEYDAAHDQFFETALTAGEVKELYASAVYQTVLRGLHEIFAADGDAFIDSVVFNGYVRTMDGASGEEIEPCIVALRADREAFFSASGDEHTPEACFRALGGRAGQALHLLEAIEPIPAAP